MTQANHVYSNRTKEGAPNLFYTQPDRILQPPRRFGPYGVTTDEFENVERITRECNVYQRLANVPSRFQVVVPHTDCVFNRCVYVDLMRIGEQTVLHSVDNDTKFCAAKFLPRETTVASWETFRKIWANANVVYQDILTLDQGLQFRSADWEST